MPILESSHIPGGRNSSPRKIAEAQTGPPAKFNHWPGSSEVEKNDMMRRPTKVISKLVDSVRIIKITGRLDPGDGPDPLSDTVLKFVEQDEIDFLLDLRAVTYISSTGVGSLIKCYRAVLKQKGHVKLLSPSQSVRNILAISKLDGVFEIFEDEKDAVESFHKK